MDGRRQVVVGALLLGPGALLIVIGRVEVGARVRRRDTLLPGLVRLMNVRAEFLERYELLWLLTGLEELLVVPSHFLGDHFATVVRPGAQKLLQLGYVLLAMPPFFLRGALAVLATMQLPRALRLVGGVLDLVPRRVLGVDAPLAVAGTIHPRAGLRLVNDHRAVEDVAAVADQSRASAVVLELSRTRRLGDVCLHERTTRRVSWNTKWLPTNMRFLLIVVNRMGSQARPDTVGHSRGFIAIVRHIFVFLERDRSLEIVLWNVYI